MSLAVFFITRTYAPTRVYAVAADQLNFQARLLSGSGAVVPDGSYAVQFKLYNVSSGGVAQWTENQTVTVRAGYLSVYLGSVTPMPTSIDWTQQEWLTMNVNSDGEMSPRVQLTAVPYALRSKQADTLSDGNGSTLGASNFAQLAPASTQLVNTLVAALRINQTGAGALAQLQHNGGDVFTIANTGDLTSSGSATFSGGTLTLGGAAQLGGLVLQDGAGKNGTLKTAALGANRTYTLPNADGTILLDTTIGNGFFAQNGNSFGGLAALGTNDNYALNFRTNNINQLTLDTSGNLNLLNGGLQIAGTTVLTSAKVLQNVTANTNILTAGLLTNARGGTGVDTSAAANGQLLIGNGTGFSLSTIANNGGLTITNSAGGIGLAVNYGSLTTNAVRGDTTLICPSGAGNLNGTGNTITLGTGGTCNSLDTKAAVSFSTSVTTPIITNAGTLAISTTGANDLSLTSGSGLVLFNTSTIRRTAAGTTTYDLADGSNTTFAFTNSGIGVVNLTVDGNGSFGTGLSVLAGGAAITGNTSVAGGTFTTSGGLVSLNDGSNFGTNINTGSSSGTVSIGGGFSPLIINSTNFDVTSAGALSGITSLSLSGAISGATSSNTINGLVINSGALNAVTGIAFTSGSLNLNTGGITNTGSIAGATTINASGLVTSVGNNAGIGLIQNSGGLTSTGSILLNDNAGTNTTNIGTGTTTGQISIGGGTTPLVINSTNFDVSSAGVLSGITGLTVVSGGSSISGGLNNNNSGITNAGSITGVGANITGTGALTVASGGAGNLLFDSASNIIQIAASDTTLQRTAAGTYNIDLLDAVGATTLSVSNSDATQVANLSVEGDVNIGAGKLYKVGGTQISSANLSNDANLAKLNGTGPQTFTGSNKFTGTVLGVVDSATAFQVQAATGNTPVLTVDTTAKVVVVNSGSYLRLAGVSTDPASPVDGDIWYNSTQKSHRVNDPIGKLGLVGLLYTNTSPSNSIVNTVTETNFNTNTLIPANALAPGKVIRITARGLYGTQNLTPPTLNLRTKLGATVLGTSGNITTTGNLANAGFKVEFDITVNSIGATGTIEGQGTAIVNSGAFAANVADMQNTTIVTVDTTLAQTLQLSAQWGTANAANTITLRQVTYEVLN